MRWALYYDDLTVWRDDDGPWQDAPVEGVIAAVEAQGERFTVHSGADYYQLEDDGTIVMREASTILHAVGLLEMGPVKFGRYTSNRKMERTFQRIRDEWGDSWRS